LNICFKIDSCTDELPTSKGYFIKQRISACYNQLKHYAKLVEYWNKFRAVAPILAAPVPLANVFLQMKD
jgi:hypothetical protein